MLAYIGPGPDVAAVGPFVTVHRPGVPNVKRKAEGRSKAPTLGFAVARSEDKAVARPQGGDGPCSFSRGARLLTAGVGICCRRPSRTFRTLIGWCLACHRHCTLPLCRILSQIQE